jgi:hypothetical protein
VVSPHPQPETPVRGHDAANHEAMRPLLPRYAAGTLSDAESGAVRAHLASGCRDCLHDVFSRPVGLPPRPDTVNVPAGARPVARRPLVAVAVLSLALISVAASMIVDRSSRDVRAGEESAHPADGLEEIEQLRASLASRLGALERAAASAEIASREADQARTAMAGVERELEATRLRMLALKRAMRRQDTDFREKQKSMDAVLARLAEPPPSSGEDGDMARCDRAPESARQVCNAFCSQSCARTSGPQCELLRARYRALTGASVPPCAVATGTSALAPCEHSHLDMWSFVVRRGYRYTLQADTADAATAADLCFVGSCQGGEAFAGDDEVPCRAPGFGCPRATFVASADTTCVVNVTICSAGCQDPSSARYEVTVEGAESVTRLADDVS